MIRRLHEAAISGWSRVDLRFLPFADAVTEELPLGRLLRLSLFQVSVGMAMVMVYGLLNRVMIVELEVSAWVVASMVSLPVVFAPLRAFVGFRSDHHRSFLGWKRVPYIWMGTLLQFGGFSFMPFALLVLGGDGRGPVLYGHIGAALAFLLVGAGVHTVQTAGLALATDLAPERARPRVIAFLYCALLLGMIASALVFGRLLQDFNAVRLIKVVQGVALLTMVLNVLALWKQEARNPAATDPARERPAFRAEWARLVQTPGAARFLLAVGLGTAGFSMQDILLEPYGGQVLHLPVSATTSLTAVMAGGALTAYLLAGRWMTRGGQPCRLAGLGGVVGILGLLLVVLARPLDAVAFFWAGCLCLGFGNGLFAVGTLTLATLLRPAGDLTGLALGAWGAVQATAAGLAVALGGGLRDIASSLAAKGFFGSTLSDTATGYAAVYQLEILLLFVTLVVLGPLVNLAPRAKSGAGEKARFGLADLPG